MRQCSRPLLQVFVSMAQQDTSTARGAIGILHSILSVVRAKIISGAVAHRATGLGAASVLRKTRHRFITNCNKLSNLSYNTRHAIDEVDCAMKEQR